MTAMLASASSAASSIHPVIATAASVAASVAPSAAASTSLTAILATAVVGLALMSIAGWAIKPVMTLAVRDLPLTPPSPDIATKWAELTGGNEGGAIIGGLERVSFFLAFWLEGGVAGAAVVAAWLTFKLGSKWQAWTQTIALPENLDGIDAIDYLVARRRWGSRVLTTFLVGTLSNVLVGMVGGVLAQHLCDTTGVVAR